MADKGIDSTGRFPTIVDLLRSCARELSELNLYTFLKDGDSEEGRLNCRQLDRKAVAIAHELRSRCACGDRALLLHPQGLDFIAAFFGCLYAGVVAVPAYPPRPNRSRFRVFAISRDARPRMALTTADLLGNSRALYEEEDDLPSVEWLATDRIAGDPPLPWQPPEDVSESLAYLQYTSGSTASPKGVMVSHRNLMHNLRDLDEGWHHTSESVLVTWLPLFHDMGFVYGILEPLYRGIRCYVMPPAAFIQRPIRWLRAISKYRATHSAAPNFAYDLCTRKIKVDECAGLDLSCWKAAVNGAEPVRMESIESFSTAFRACGFKRDAFCPGYGLAEATLKVTAVRDSEAPTYLSVDAGALGMNRAAEPSSPNAPQRVLVGCGRAALATRVVIADPESRMSCPPGRVGEIWVCGPSVTQGYWNCPEQTTAVFQAFLTDKGEGPFLRTGDLGFLRDGQLFVTGRLKDLIIIRGQNHYPQDIERTVEQSHSALRPAGCAAFSIEAGGEERLVVVQEVERGHRNLDRGEVLEAVRAAVAEEHELQVYALLLVKPGAIPRTSSGKVQREACRTGYLSGTLEIWERVAVGLESDIAVDR